MRIAPFATALLAPLALSACCAPDSCYTAQSRFDKLDPVTEQLLIFEEQYGRFPESLEEAFPKGLPNGIRPVKDHKGLYRFAQEDSNFPTFSYGREAEPGGPRDEITLHFSYVGGGLLAGMNDCFWTESKREWTCSGYI